MLTDWQVARAALTARPSWQEHALWPLGKSNCHTGPPANLCLSPSGAAVRAALTACSTFTEQKVLFGRAGKLPYLIISLHTQIY